MKIKEILTQHRNDFTALLLCEHCGHTQKLMTGYDDDYYHDNVIPSQLCQRCKKSSNNENKSEPA